MWVAEFRFPGEAAAATDVVEPPAVAELACIDTHDTPTFAAWWRDLEAVPRTRLLATLRAAGDLDEGPDQPIDAATALASLLSWLGRSRAPLVLASLEDLWLESVPQNVPGAGADVATFRQRAAHGIEELDRLPSVTHALDRLDLARRSIA